MYLDSIIEQLENAKQLDELGSLPAVLDSLIDECRRLSLELIDIRDYCESYNQPLCITDGQGIITYMNDEYERQTRLSREDALGKPEPFVKPISARVLQEKKTVSFGNDGVRLGLESGRFVAGIPIFDDEGKIRSIAITLSSQDAVIYRYHELRRIINLKDSARIVTEAETNDDSEVLLGRNEKIEGIRRLIRKVAPTDASILITGESGTGKEVAADCIYNLSRRKGKPYVKINCAAIPANLLEAELFGYAPGAFTGAGSKGKTGLLEMANHGTVLLDEIGDFPLELQPKLLRVLQQGEIYRVGSSTPIKLDIRLIAATNSDLRKKLQEGSFREDLYYRLSVVPIEMPPLRAHKEDIRGLVRHFVYVYNEKYNRNAFVSPEIMQALERHDWPGNVRELQNIVEYFVIIFDNEHVMSPDELEVLLRSRSSSQEQPAGKTLLEKRDNFEKSLIEEAISTSASLRQAAEKLGIFPSSLYRKLHKYDIPYKHLSADADA